jgi:hypothetical protein
VVDWGCAVISTWYELITLALLPVVGCWWAVAALFNPSRLLPYAAAAYSVLFTVYVRPPPPRGWGSLQRAAMGIHRFFRHAWRCLVGPDSASLIAACGALYNRWRIVVLTCEGHGDCLQSSYSKLTAAADGLRDALRTVVFTEMNNALLASASASAAAAAPPSMDPSPSTAPPPGAAVLAAVSSPSSPPRKCNPKEMAATASKMFDLLNKDGDLCLDATEFAGLERQLQALRLPRALTLRLFSFLDVRFPPRRRRRV